VSGKVVEFESSGDANRISLASAVKAKTEALVNFIPIQLLSGLTLKLTPNRNVRADMLNNRFLATFSGSVAR